QELFSMSPSASDESVFNTVALPNGDAAVVALTDVSPGSADDNQLDELKSQMQNRQAQVMLQAFINNLKTDADIQRLSTR
ncbi:MAG: SurA N-terminal domain-containing protein, partial [Idiomarina loihiensis]